MTDKISAGSSNPKLPPEAPRMTPTEADRLIEWHQMAAQVSEQTDDFAGARWHREKLAAWRAWRGVARASDETVSTPDAWMVLGEDGWRYLSGGEGDARQRMHSPTDKLYPLYRGELKVEICPWKGIPKDECRKCRESMEHAQKAAARQLCTQCTGWLDEHRHWCPSLLKPQCPWCGGEHVGTDCKAEKASAETKV